MFKFTDFIERNFLVNLPLVGNEYTWFRESVNPSMSRMDRVLVSVDWEDHFLEVIQRPLPCVVSDHCLLLWRQVAEREGRVPLNLKICGLKWRVLWTEFSVGGTVIILWDPLVMF